MEAQLAHRDSGIKSTKLKSVRFAESRAQAQRKTNIVREPTRSRGKAAKCVEEVK